MRLSPCWVGENRVLETQVCSTEKYSFLCPLVCTHIVGVGIPLIAPQTSQNLILSYLKNCSDGSIAVYNYDFNVHLLDCYLFEYSLFISCAGSSLLWGLSSGSCVQGSHCGGFSCCGPQGLGRLGLSRSGTPLQCSCLESPRDGGAWWAAVYEVARVGHDWATSLSLFTFMRWRRKWHPTPVFLPGESQGWGSLVGCSPWGRTESDMTERLSSSSSRGTQAYLPHGVWDPSWSGVAPVSFCTGRHIYLHIFFNHRITREVLIWTLKIFFSYLRLLPFFCAVVDFFLMSSSSWYTMDMNFSGLPSHFLYETEMNRTEIFVIEQKFSNFFKLTTFW